MRNYYCELNWPILNNSEYLINRINEFPDYLSRQVNGEQMSYTENNIYANLINWPTRHADVSNIIKELPVSPEMINYTTIQRISPPTLPMHIDKNRAVSAMCILQGSAWTVFQEEGQLLHRTMFEKNKWYLFNNKILHGVKGLKSLRISLCLDFTNFYSYKEALNEFCT